jgi:HK97 family phage prohead protease
MEKKLFNLAEVKFATSDDTATKTFDGYGAVFSNVDAYGDVIAPGAFAKSLKSGAKPLMFLNHDMFSLPIGLWTDLAEDDFGLKVSGEFIDTQVGRDTYLASKAGAITGLSIGYIPTEVAYGKLNSDEPARTIKALDLIEISVVTIPANSKARIVDVKSLKQPEDFERELVRLGMNFPEAKSFLEAVSASVETKYKHKADLVAATTLLSKLLGE